ncbi:MAG: hypothetical protein C4516_09775 [Oxalobacter sp.]|nr:MAG: hypothetical protein C4516_09775 [Oxalobacter sp.]
MIDLTPEDAAVIFRIAATKDLDYLPVPQLNDEGQTEIVGWIESVGKLDDQLTPYAWFSLAEEAALANDPDEPVTIEILPTYTRSGESEFLDLSREDHFDWSIDHVPVSYIQNPIVLLDMDVPARFLLLTEEAGDAFVKHVCEFSSELADIEPQLRALAMNAFFEHLCESAGVELDDMLLLEDDDEMSVDDIDIAEYEEIFEEGLEAAKDALIALDPDLAPMLRDMPNPFEDL